MAPLVRGTTEPKREKLKTALRSYQRYRSSFSTFCYNDQLVWGSNISSLDGKLQSIRRSGTDPQIRRARSLPWVQNQQVS